MILSEEEVRQAVEAYIQARMSDVSYVSKVTPLKMKRKPVVYSVAVTHKQADANSYPVAEED